jgi:hypothetical protein
MNSNRQKKPKHRAAHGYGMALLLMFVASTVLIGVSFQLVSTPSSISHLGTASQDYLSAKQVAMTGFIATEADIQSKLNSGATIDLTYRYPTSSTVSVTVPSDPSNLSSSGVQVGSYYATVSAVRGNSYLVKVTATVGSATASLSRLFLTKNASTLLLDDIPGIQTIYALRKLKTSYSGSAIRVRRPSDNTEQDIGFDSSNNLDTAALMSFLGGTLYPVDSVPGAAGAYSLRKLSASYSGNAIRVRRSSDNTEQDIGFKSTGYLDTSALTSFVGSGSGYITKWYDQSGNGRDLFQTSAIYQPRIVNAGTVETTQGKPTIWFDGSNDHLNKMGMSISTTGLTACSVAMLSSATNTYARLLVVHKTGDAYDYTTQSSAVVYDKDEFSAALIAERNNAFLGKRAITYGNMFQATSLFNGTNHTMRVNEVAGTTVASTGTFTINTFYVGMAASGVYWEEQWLGTMNEILIYPTALSSANMQLIEKSQAFYYNTSPVGYVTTWYDQSGNGKNATQTTTANQPLITMDLKTGRPTIWFDGSNDVLFNSSMSTTYTGANFTASFVASYTPSTYNWARFVSLHKTNDANEWSTPSSYQLLALQGNWTDAAVENYSKKVTATNSFSTYTPFQASIYHDSANLQQLYVNGTYKGQHTTATGMSLASDYLILGAGRQTSTIVDHLNGGLSEFIGASSAWSTTNRQTVENDVKAYFAIP